MKVFWLLLSSIIFVQSGGNTVNVPIVNPSFEQHPLLGTYANLELNGTICGPSGWTGIPGWTFSNATGVFQPDVSQPPSWPCYNTQPPDGSTVAYAQGSSITQDLGVKISDLQTFANGADGDGFYLMTFYVANQINAYPGYYEVKIRAGTHELCSTNGLARRNWQKITLTCPSPSYVVYDNWPATLDSPESVSSPDDHLIISLSNMGGWALMFDNVSLTFTPVN